MEQEPQFTLQDFNTEELDNFNTALQKFLDEQGAHLMAKAGLTEQGTIQAKLFVSKKVEVEVIPKAKPEAPITPESFSTTPDEATDVSA